MFTSAVTSRTRYELFGVVALGTAFANVSQAQAILTEGTNISADISVKQEIAMDLLGSIWKVPKGGGKASLLTSGLVPARRPRWSPDGSEILYQSESPQGTQLWIIDAAAGTPASALAASEFSDQFGAWHPSGERVVFSSARDGHGFDLWETDLQSGLVWRLTDLPGDEMDPVWTANGRHLAYLHRDADRWTLMLRRFGMPDEALYVSESPLWAPAWRPDGSLLTFLGRDDEGLSLNMLIVSNPPIVRRLVTGEDFFLSPVSWVDRNEFIYTADGFIKRRKFSGRRAEVVRFTARSNASSVPAARLNVERKLPVRSPPDGRLVIRARRLFDGVRPGYQSAFDVLLEDGVIAAVTPRRDWPDANVLDLGDATILPGLIDTYAALPDGVSAAAGIKFLAYGITTIVSETPAGQVPMVDWDSEATPGPRLLRAGSTMLTTDTELAWVRLPTQGDDPVERRARVATWQQKGTPVLVQSWNVGLNIGADLLLGAQVFPASPLGRQYQDIGVTTGAGPITIVSGMADTNTPGMRDLLDSRQAKAFGQASRRQRRNVSTPHLSAAARAIVAGSQPNSLPSGLALHAELRALSAAGLEGARLLNTAGSNAAEALGFSAQLGRIEPGAMADLVLVSGDPLSKVADMLTIVAVVRNGRFFSLVSLLERRAAPAGVE